MKASQLFVTGNNSVIAHEMVFKESTTFTPDEDIWVVAHVIGGGGGGAVGGTGNVCLVTGGSAGAYGASLLKLTAGTTYTITVGAGAAPRVEGWDGVGDWTGYDGGDSVFSGSDITTITAEGGPGGVGSTTYNGQPAEDLQPAAASATGGNLFNHDGGRGGRIEWNGNGTDVGCATGGGAVALFGIPYDGGSIDYTSSGASGAAATGGGGVGGHGGSVIKSSGTGTNETAGGTALGTPDEVTNADGTWGPNVGSTNERTDAPGSLMTAVSRAVNTQTSNPASPGHGGYGHNTYSTYCDASLWGGGGGAYRGGAVLAGAGAGGFPGGGGGGGVVFNYATGDTHTGSTGGDGAVILQILGSA